MPYVTWRGNEYELSEDDTIVSKRVGSLIIYKLIVIVLYWLYCKKKDTKYSYYLMLRRVPPITVEVERQQYIPFVSFSHLSQSDYIWIFIAPLQQFYGKFISPSTIELTHVFKQDTGSGSETKRFGWFMVLKCAKWLNRSQRQIMSWPISVVVKQLTKLNGINRLWNNKY